MFSAHRMVPILQVTSQHSSSPETIVLYNLNGLYIIWPVSSKHETRDNYAINSASSVNITVEEQCGTSHAKYPAVSVDANLSRYIVQHWIHCLHFPGLLTLGKIYEYNSAKFRVLIEFKFGVFSQNSEYSVLITKVHPFSGPQNSLKLTLKKYLKCFVFLIWGINDTPLPQPPSVLHLYKTPLHT
jgi:hypothetical protein